MWRCSLRQTGAFLSLVSSLSCFLSWQGIPGLPGNVGDPGLVGQRVSIPHVINSNNEFLKKGYKYLFVIGSSNSTPKGHNCVIVILSIRVCQAWKGRMEQMDPMEPRQV